MAGEGAVHEPTTGRTWTEFARAFRHPLRLLSDLVTRVYDDDILILAAALAYYFFFSLFPLLIFVLAVTSMMRLPGLEAWLLENAARSLPGEAYTLIERTVRGLLETPRSGLVSIGAVLTLWTASAAFSAVMNGLNRAYRVRDPRPWWQARLYAIGLTVGLSAFMIVAFGLTVFGGELVDLVKTQLGPAAGTMALVVRWTITVGAVLLVVAAIYYACPAIEKDWQWMRPGAVLFTLGFAASSYLFSYWVGRFGSYDATYGSLGAVIILLVWMYLLGLFLLLGGELNALLEARLQEREAAEQERIGEEQAAEPRAEDALERVAR
ncbi:MAG TPA: YihY/virulence factor BrkB family protein [Solirubrobacterales bacterium]|nr:YihY/virulence factor BrkB family protein [Solirubrobacterales bacterium]